MARGPAKSSANKVPAKGATKPTTPGKRRKPPAISRSLSEAVGDALELIFCTDKELVAVLDRLSDGGAQAVDYEVESRLESLASAVADPKCAVLEVADERAARGTGFVERLMRRWLEGSVDGCGFEAKVRASEVLAEWSVRTQEPRSAVAKRLKSKRWEHRMWAARAVRRAGWEDADALLAPLENDPFEDDNGFFLVREAAGF
jgi:hypothetical protein